MDKAKLITRTVTTPCDDIQIRESENGTSRTITGRAIVFNQLSAPLFEDERDVIYEKVSPDAVTDEVLKASDIKMTMFHDRQLILARSNKGKGTLKYTVDEAGVTFEFEAPNTIDGDKALELVKRGDISGCSFAFSTYYYDEDYVECECKKKEGGKRETTYTVKRVLGVFDFTLAADPAYPSTSVEARELIPAEKPKGTSADVKELRENSKTKILIS